MAVKNKKRLVLLDTHAIIHRAYHALPDFTGPGGEPTGALYGLVTMLLKIVSELSPDYLAACYDLPQPTARHEAYEGYKGTRAKIDDALALQITRSRKVFDAFCVPVYERAGFEADDLLGTIAEAMKGEVDVIIASGDMDTLQLVDNARVRVYTLKRGLSDTILYDEKAVSARFGFPPALLADYKGLRGDPSDNIKGVPGIGEKTATELVQKFGSIEKIYAALKKGDKKFLAAGIKPRTVALLKEHEEAARLSKALATIRLDAPIAFALPDKAWRENIDFKKILVLFDELGFRSLKERARSVLKLEDASATEAETAPPAEEDVDPALLAQAEVKLWLLCSDFTNPTLDDILAYTKKGGFNEADAELDKLIAATGSLKAVYEKIERPLTSVLSAMELRGVRIDTEVLGALATSYRRDLELLEREIYKSAGQEFNISSPRQLGEILFDKLGLTPERQKKTAGGQRSTRESELEKIRTDHPIVGQILEYRELKKLLSTYIDTLPSLLDTNQRLHAEFLQCGTVTGRLASQNPNLQNIPLHSERGRAIRHAFVAPRGYALVALDYSQIELRIAAILSGDPIFCEIFRSGRDVHHEVAKRVFHVEDGGVTSEMRRRAKAINFGILYGMGVNALRAQLGTTTAEAHAFYDEYFGQFKRLAEYLEETKGFARKHGYTETLFGRRRQFPEMKSPLPYVRAQAERMALNAPIQGTQADIIKLAMVRVDDYLKEHQADEEAHLLMQVHDELVYEIKKPRVEELARAIQKIMEGALEDYDTHSVPIIAVPKAGPTWGDLTPL